MTKNVVDNKNNNSSNAGKSHNNIWIFMVKAVALLAIAAVVMQAVFKVVQRKESYEDDCKERRYNLSCGNRRKSGRN